jgi:hypothetical protein
VGWGSGTVDSNGPSEGSNLGSHGGAAPRPISWSGIASAGLAAVASAGLVFAVTHERITRGRPLLTSVRPVGPAAEWVTTITIGAWLISLAVVPPLAAQALKRRGRWWVLAFLAIYLVVLNLFGTFIFVGLLED